MAKRVVTQKEIKDLKKLFKPVSHPEFQRTLGKFFRNEIPIKTVYGLGWLNHAKIS